MAGVDCSGCIIATVRGKNVELQSDNAGAVSGVVQIDILRRLLKLDC